jgi:hypothetical protein
MELTFFVVMVVTFLVGRNKTYNPLGKLYGGGDNFSQCDPHGTMEKESPLGNRGSGGSFWA